MMRRILREPLLHFLILAGLIFIVYGLFSGERFSARERIEVPAAKIEQLVGLFTKTWQRPPTAKELKGLIDEYVADEVYYREARKLGLDEDDTVIRRRMRLKMELITDAVVDQLQPGDEELAKFLQDNSADFATEPSLALKQVYLSPERRGAALEANAAALLMELREGRADPAAAGDQTLLPAYLPLSSQGAIAREFGAEFAAALLPLPIGNWEGPVTSSYGLHLVRIGERQEGRLPDLNDIRGIVEREWKAKRRSELQQQRLEQLATQYDIVIETEPKK